MLRKLKWKIPGEPLAARYNWCQGPVSVRGPAVEKHCCKQHKDLPVPAMLTRMRWRTACRVYISPLCSNGRELRTGCKNVFSRAFLSYSITFMVAMPTVRKYQAVDGAVGQGFLQRRFFSNPAFEECVATGAHVASVTWTFCKVTDY